MVLAGGDGSHLRHLSPRAAGDERKRLCDMWSNGSTTLTREQSYKPLLDGAPPGHSFEQPTSRGSGVAILLSILKIMRFDPSALVGIFPSDHYFSGEGAYSRYVEFMFNGAEYLPDRVVLLGIPADRPETDCDWIEPVRSGILPVDGSLRPVKRYWEKPPLHLSESLMEQGCLWNTFVMAGTARAFLNLIRRARPDLFASVRLPATSDPEQKALSSVPCDVPNVDFSGDILACCPDELSVVSAVGHCEQLRRSGSIPCSYN
jgi:mannose-1-phosphate guanylyltransferase